MEQKQFLTEQQISSLRDIIIRDYVTNQVDEKRNSVLNSDEFKRKVEEIKSTQEYIEYYADCEKRRDNNLKLSGLYKQIVEIDPEALSYEDSYGDACKVSWLITASEEQIEENFKDGVKEVDDKARYEAIYDIKLSGRWDIESFIQQDITARLRLITPGTFDEIITDVVSHIDIDKYLYSK